MKSDRIKPKEEPIIQAERISVPASPLEASFSFPLLGRQMERVREAVTHTLNYDCVVEVRVAKNGNVYFDTWHGDDCEYQKLYINKPCRHDNTRPASIDDDRPYCVSCLEIVDK